MVEMMQGVTRPGGTAPGASAAGHQLAGKTGTVNDHTDVWFIGYTPSYATGVWMGNPERKESLGRGMTGGGGALPYFNTFMNEFMKDKPKDKFPEPPPIPADMKAQMERRKREEMEKLEKAEMEARKTGAIYTPSKRVSTKNSDATDDEDTSTPDETTGTDATTPKTNPVPKNDEPVKPSTKVITVPPKKPEPAVEKPPQNEGTKRKGKKGDG